MTYFKTKYNTYCDSTEKVYLTNEDVVNIITDVEFGYCLASLISPKSRKVNCVQLITALEMIASMSTDAKWLNWLKYQFTEAMEDSTRLNNNEVHVTLADFINNFNFKEPFLAQRLFNYLDTDRSGHLSLHEFINGLEVVVNGTKEQKVEFLFKVSFGIQFF
jgi:Ca2+-binding EF-hand superfamily protein